MEKDPRALGNWKSKPKKKIGSSSNSKISTLLRAIEEGEELRIRYNSGSNPGAERTISPEEVFERAGRSYVRAYCHEREESRVFRTTDITFLGQQRSQQTVQPKKVISPPQSAPPQPVRQVPASVPATNTGGSGCLVVFLILISIASIAVMLIKSSLA